MKYITYITLLLFSCGDFERSSLQNKDRIIGIWLISDFSINGYDKTRDINHPHKQWVELIADGTFRSGSYKIENSGTWHLKGDDIIEMTGQNEDWCNSAWRLQVNAKNLALKGRPELGTSTVSILLDKTEKLPIYKQYLGKPVDKLVGLWKAESNSRTLDTGFWIRMKRQGNFSVGDSSGILFNGEFLYTHNDSSLIFEKSNEELAHWKVYFEDNHHMVLKKSLEDAQMKLKRVATFAID